MKPFSCPACKGYMIMDDETVAGPSGKYYLCAECGNHFEPTDTQGYECEMEPPLEPKRLCEKCGRWFATQEIVYIGESSTQIREFLCQECAQNYWESIEPVDAHYYPRS